MVSPKVMIESTFEIAVPIALNMETKTGPFFFIAHPLKLTLDPPTAPTCAHPRIMKLA